MKMAAADWQGRTLAVVPNPHISGSCCLPALGILRADSSRGVIGRSDNLASCHLLLDIDALFGQDGGDGRRPPDWELPVVSERMVASRTTYSEELI